MYRRILVSLLLLTLLVAANGTLAVAQAPQVGMPGGARSPLAQRQTILYSREPTTAQPHGTAWLSTLDGSHVARVTDGAWPRLSPGGRYVAFLRDDFRMNVNYPGTPVGSRWPAWSQDSQWISYAAAGQGAASAAPERARRSFTDYYDFVGSVGSGTIPGTPAEITWVDKAPLSVPRWSLVVVAGANGKVYTIGGQQREFWDGGVSLDVVEAYDPAAGTWTTKAPVPIPHSSLGVAVTKDGRIWAVGAADGPATVAVYDPALDLWTTRPSTAPTRHYAFTATAGNDGKIYVFGGLDGSGPVATAESYDPQTDTWTTLPSMRVARWNHRAVLGANGKIYVIGGYNGSYLPTVEEYDPVTRTWAMRAPMLHRREGPGLVSAMNGKIYAIGGRPTLDTSGGSALTSVEEYDPLTDTWSEATPIRVAREFLGAAQAGNGKIYVIGGKVPGDQPIPTEEGTIVGDSGPTFSVLQAGARPTIDGYLWEWGALPATHLDRTNASSISGSETSPAPVDLERGPAQRLASGPALLRRRGYR